MAVFDPLQSFVIYQWTSGSDVAVDVQVKHVGQLEEECWSRMTSTRT